MSKIDKSLSETFGVDPVWSPDDISFPLAETNEASVPAVLKAESDAEETDQQKIESDIEFSRQKLLSLLTKGEDAFEYLLHLAKSEERTSAFEVLNSMLANMTDMSMKIIDIQEKKKKLLAQTAKKDGEETPVSNNTTNNIIFTGTTSELQELIKKQLKGSDDDIIEGE